MPLLHGLHTVCALGDAQRERSLVVGDNGLLVGIDHQYAVATELYARNGYGGAFVIDMTAIVIIGVDGEDEIIAQVHILVKADSLRIETARVAH